MGLDTSHDAWHGSYSGFNSLRQVVCAVFGGSYPPHTCVGWGAGTITRDDLLGKTEPLDDTMIYFCPPGENVDVPEGLYEFLTHSDCDGEIAPEMCAKVADDLEALLPKIEAFTGTSWSGHVERAGGYAAAVRQFIAGCRAAHAAGEPLDFH